MSAEDLAARLPDINTLRSWCRSLAVLDAIMSPEWEYRYFSFDPAWSDREEMASMRNGSGDEYTIVFGPAGVFIRGFDHESPLSPWAQEDQEVVRGLTEGVPASFAEQLTEPAFSTNDVLAITVCVWREIDDDRWHAGRAIDASLLAKDDGADWLFEELDGRADSYVSFAEDYFEQPVRADVVRQVLEESPLTFEMVISLNAEADAEATLAEVAAMGYPVD